MSSAFRSYLDPWRPGVFPYRRFLLTLAIALAGGICFALVRWPLAWMIGPMLFCAVAALSRVPVSGPAIIRPPALVLVGVGIGASFSPALLASIPGYATSLVLLFLLLIASVVACYLYFRIVGRLSPSTSLFAAMPGGLNEMILLSEQHHADARAVALVQTSRVIFVIALIPIIIRLDRPYDTASVAPLARAAWTATDAAILLGCGIVGIVLGRIARFPTPYLFGPLAVSALVHSLGWTGATLPTVLTNGAQLFLGVVLGCRFAGMALRKVAKLLVVSLGAAAILLAVAWAFARLGSSIMPTEFVSLILAYAPGGVAEMSLAALALHVDPAIVAVHHVFRIVAIILLVRPVHTLLLAWTRGRT